MTDIDKIIVRLIKRYRGKILNLHSILKRDSDNVDADYIFGMIDAYKKVIDELGSLL